MLKKSPSDKINDTKNALFFLSQVPTHHSFTFNLRFLHELKHKVHLFKNVCGIFPFQFRFVFIYFSIWVFFHSQSQITGLQGKGGISLTPHYHFHHFHLLHRHLDISRAITAESSPLHISSSWTRTRKLWFPSTSC